MANPSDPNAAWQQLALAQAYSAPFAALASNPYAAQGFWNTATAMNPLTAVNSAFQTAAALNSANAQSMYGPEAQVEIAQINAQNQRQLAPWQALAGYAAQYPGAAAAMKSAEVGSNAQNYQSQLAAELAQATGGTFNQKAQQAGNMGLMGLEGQLQGLQPTLQAGIDTTAIPGAFGLAGQGVQSNLATTLADINLQPSFELPQLQGIQGLTANQQNALQQEALGALNQQGNLLNSAIGGNTALGTAGLNANAEIAKNNVNAEVPLATTYLQNRLAGALGAMNNTAAGQYLGTNTTAGLQQQIQDLRNQDALATLGANLTGQQANLAAGVNTFLPQLAWQESGGQQALGANLSGEQQTQQTAGGLLGQLENQNFNAGQLANTLNAQKYGQLLGAEGGTLGSEIGAQAGQQGIGTTALAQDIPQLAANQTAGGTAAINANEALDQAAMQTGAKMYGQSIMKQVFDNLFNHVPQIGSGPGGFPSAGPIPPPPTQVTGIDHSGNVFQNEMLNEALPGISSPAAPSTPAAASVAASAAPAIPSPASFTSGLPTFSNPYTENEGDLNALAAFAGKPLMTPVTGLTSPSETLPGYRANENSVLAKLPGIGPFSNPYSTPEANSFTPIGSFNNPYAGPSSQNVTLPGTFSNPYSDSASIALAGPLQTPHVSAPSGDWYGGLTQGVGSVPLPAVQHATTAQAPHVPDMSALLAQLTQGPQTSQGPLTQFAQQMASQQSLGNNPWTGQPNTAPPVYQGAPRNQFNPNDLAFNFQFA